MCFLKVIVYENRAVLADLKCLNWICDKCREYLKWQWTGHLVPRMLQCDMVCRMEIDKADWTNLYARLNRAGHKYVKIEIDGWFAVYADGPFACRGMAAEQMTARDGARWLADDIGSLTSIRRPINTSAPWSLAEAKRRNAVESVAGEVQPGTYTPEQFRTAAEAVGLDVVASDTLCVVKLSDAVQRQSFLEVLRASRRNRYSSRYDDSYARKHGRRVVSMNSAPGLSVSG